MTTNKLALPNVERCRAFWAREEVDRPLLSTWVGSFEMSGLYPHGLARLPAGELAPGDVDFELFRRDYETLAENNRRACADVPWSAYPVMVLPWLEAVAGCRIVHSAGNIWAEPRHDWSDSLASGQPLQPRLDWMEKLVEFTDWLVKLSDGRFPVAVSLMRGPTDVLAALRGAQDSVLDLVDHPQSVVPILEGITDLWVQVAQAQLSRVPLFAGGHGWSVQNLWSDEPGVWFQDDAIAYWSPKLYQTYAWPYEKKLSESIARTGVHLHSASIFTVDGLLKMPSLGVIEMNLDVTGKTIPEMIPAFRKILETQRLYVWGHFTVDDLVLMKEQLPARGLALQLMYETADEVRAMVERTERIWLG